MNEVTIYQDGSCTRNPGSGGYGVGIKNGNQRKEISGGYIFTTINRMELLAAIIGLESLNEPSMVTLFSDSRYLVDGIKLGWAKKWQKNNWYRTRKEKASNQDLWEILLSLCDKHKVEFHWVRAHNGNKENERCDELSYEAAKEIAKAETTSPKVEINPERI